jgi:hypothetical protein
MATRPQCSGIPVGLLRCCRAVISRKTDPSGKAVWVAEMPDLPFCRATGSSRMEALDRVRRMAEREGDAGGIRRGLPSERPGVAGLEARSPRQAAAASGTALDF